MKQKNWAGNQTLDVESIAQPRNAGEVAALVRDARKRRKLIRPIGSLHSWSPLCNDAAILISLSAMDQQLKLDSGDKVRCSGGVKLEKLADYLHQNGLSLPVMGDSSQQTIAGGISTGTHGPSICHRIVADNVSGMTLVDGTGTVQTLTAQDERLSAARVALGLFGVITEVEITPTPAKYLNLDIRVQRDEEWIPHIQDDIDSNEFYFSYRYSHTNLAVVHKGRTLAEPVEYSISNTRPHDQDFEEVVPALYRLAYRSGLGAREVNTLITKVFFRDQTLCGPLHQVLVSDFNSPVSNTEYFVPKDRAAEIFQAAMALDYPDPVFVAIRGGIRADNNWLSMAYERDSVAIGCNAFCTPFGSRIPESLRLFNHFMHQQDARPHWAKWCEHDRIDLARHFPKLEQFLKLRKQFDPDDVFLTPTLRKLLRA